MFFAPLSVDQLIAMGLLSWHVGVCPWLVASPHLVCVAHLRSPHFLSVCMPALHSNQLWYYSHLAVSIAFEKVVNMINRLLGAPKLNLRLHT